MTAEDQAAEIGREFARLMEAESARYANAALLAAVADLMYDLEWFWIDAASTARSQISRLLGFPIRPGGENIRSGLSASPQVKRRTRAPGGHRLNTRTQLVVPAGLAAAARRSALPEDTTLAALARYALAKLAGWPTDAALTVARGRRAAR